MHSEQRKRKRTGAERRSRWSCCDSRSKSVARRAELRSRTENLHHRSGFERFYYKVFFFYYQVILLAYMFISRMQSSFFSIISNNFREENLKKKTILSEQLKKKPKSQKISEDLCSHFSKCYQGRQRKSNSGLLNSNRFLKIEFNSKTVEFSNSSQK